MKLARAMVEHKVILELLATWWINPDTCKYQKCTALPVLAYSEKKFTYLNAEILDPQGLHEATELQLSVSTGKWNLCSLLDINFHFPKTLSDVNLSARTKALAAAIRHWSEVGGVVHSTSTIPVDVDTPTCSAHV
eukprot:460270-Rhodomonas_salina.3